MIEPGKLKDIREESERVVATRGDSWNPTYVKNRAAITLELLDEIARLQELVKEVPFKVGDVVREVGEEELTGTILEVKTVNDEQVTKVKLFTPVPRYDGTSYETITYYADEIELMVRGND